MKASLEKLSVDARAASADVDKELHKRIASAFGLPSSAIEGYRILKRSVDARRKPELKILYKLEVSIKDGSRPARPLEAPEAEPPPWLPPEAKNKTLKNPIVVGSGPAGLFAALALAVAGREPIIVERGRDVVARKADIDKFFSTRQPDPESNLLFGEGGAGTWSDGKLFTRVRDPRVRFVLEGFVAAGAQPEILYFSHPHIGSDRLPPVVASVRRRIESLGGRFLWGERVERLLVENGRCEGVHTAKSGALEAPATIIASGHSSRDLILSMVAAGVPCAPKGFQIGCRAEHPQEFVNFIQYGTRQAPLALGSADYNFSSRPASDGRIQGATSFCMCPGGEILPCVTTPGALSTNGMSDAARSGRFANAAIVSAVDRDFKSVQEAFAFIERIERAAFEAGGSDYGAPAQTIESFLRGGEPVAPAKSSYAFGTVPCDLATILPSFLCEAIARACGHFDRMAPGFIKYGSLVGVETRVSSPVRFLRAPGSMESPVKGLYVVGEGAGMAGGITSAAVDGLKAAEELLLKNA